MSTGQLVLYKPLKRGLGLYRAMNNDSERSLFLSHFGQFAAIKFKCYKHSLEMAFFRRTSYTPQFPVSLT